MPSNPTRRTPKPAPQATKLPPNQRTAPRPGTPHNWPLVEVHWIDAVADGLHEWLDPNDADQLVPEHSLVIGYLVADTPNHVTIASLVNDNAIAHLLCVPKPLIVTIKHLRYK